MLTRTFFFAFSFLAILYFSSINHLFISEPKDLLEYSVLQKGKKAQENTREKKLSQLRTFVTKDLFIPKDKERLQIRIISDSSHLYLKNHKKKWSFEEDLHEIKCFSQDKIYQSDKGFYYQQVKYLEAPSGIYTFPEQTFTAEKVDLYFYHLPGKTLPVAFDGQFSYLYGYAKEVFFSLQTGNPYFIANHLQAKIRR